MKITKKSNLAYVLVLGIVLGWTGSTVLRVTQSDNQKEDPASTIAQEKTTESINEEQLRNLEVRNFALARQIDELQAQLDVYQQIERDVAENRNRDKKRMIDARLKEYEALFDLTTDQAYLIGEYEWETIQYWKDFHAGKKTVNDPIPYAEDKVREILSPEQLEIYEVHLEEKYKSGAEAVAHSQLSQYPTTLGLSEDQKDKIYTNLYYIHNRATRDDYQENIAAYRNEDRFDPGGEYLLTAAEGVLSEDQMNELEKALLSSPKP